MTLSTPDWLADAVFYQIFPERFANGDPSLDPPGTEPWGGAPTPDNFFGGDLAGIIQHLDHIVSVGANAIYLTPIFAADTNHRYDTKDYFAIDPALGSLDTFHEFVEAAHARGIRVVLDAVLNHSGDGHWAFADVVAKEVDSPYVNWYSVEGFPVRSHPTPNYRTCSGCYYLPKWNAYNPEVRNHHYRVARYWIDQGIDGWRLDVPYFINHDFWRGFRRVVKGVDEDLYIVAEEWRDPEQWLQGDIADGTMNYSLRDLVLGFTADRTLTAEAFAREMSTLTARIPSEARPAMLNLLGSHDTERVLTRHSGRVSDALLAYALLITAEGAPMLYYGDEVGLQGDSDPGCRGTMPWDRAEWSHELLQGVRSLTGLRAGHVAARRGEQLVAAWGDDVVAMLRDAGAQGLLLILVNRGDDTIDVPQAALDGSLFGRSLDVAWRVALGEGRRDLDIRLSRFTVPAHTAVILASEEGEVR